MNHLGKLLVFPGTEDRYELIVAFDSDDQEFTRGFEAGRVYEVLRSRQESSVEFQVHGTNSTMMERIAKTTGYVIDALESEGEDPEWLTLRFVRQTKI